MATLQKLRNMGPLLVIFVGIALFAFIAGDAWKVFQPHQGAQSVGSINGEELSAPEYQKMYEELSEISKFLRNSNTLTEEEVNSVKDEVWQSYVRSKIIGNEAEKIGITVTPAELQTIVNMGQDPILQQTPFRNEQGSFDKDMLANFLVQYNQNKNDEAFAQQYKAIYDYWKYIEKSINENAIAYKYQSLIFNSFLTNPIAAKNNFDANEASYDIEVAAYPYSEISDTEINVSDAEINSLYQNRKEEFKQLTESRDVKFVSFKVVPSNEDRTGLEETMSEYAQRLKDGETEVSYMVRQSNSKVPYSEIAWSKKAYPQEIQARLDTAQIGVVVGPFYNQADDSYIVYKLENKQIVPDSILYRQLVVNAATAEATKTLTDSLLGALRGGSNFAEVAQKYGQNSDSTWLVSAQYEGTATQGENAMFLKSLINAKKGEYDVIEFDNSPIKVIYQVLNTKNPITKYQAVVLKTESTFSSDTYNKAYNNFSQFVASCNTLEELEKNVEEYGFRITELNSILNNSYNVSNIKDTRNAIRWIFGAKKGEVSPLYECGENDNLLVVALTNIHPQGYSSVQDNTPMLKRELIKEKKATMIESKIKGTPFSELGKLSQVKTDTIKHVSFGAPTYISMTASSEPIISAAVTKLKAGETSAPIEGENGVYVIKVISKNEKGGTFNFANEEKSLKSLAAGSARMFLNELFEKAKVIDQRYLFF